MAQSRHGCPYAKKCGGCQLQNLTYAQQLQHKQVQCIRLLGRFCRVEEIIGMPNPYHYRNKVQAAFALDAHRNIISGVYQAASHKVVAVEHCMTEDEKADEIIATVRKLLKSFKLFPFDPDTKRGFLRHVLVKRGFRSGQIMVVLVTGVREFPKKRSFVNALLKAHPEITTVLQNVNPRRTSMVLGKEEFVLFGDGKIEEQLGDMTFRISARAFYQINPVQTEILYRKALKFADLKGHETVIDAYCGTGTIGIFAAPHAKQVIGVELNGDAVKDAKENAKINRIGNIRFFEADAGEFMLAAAQAGEHADVVLMDPPRAGSDKKFLSALVTLAPKKVVYISCNPETQQRDLLYLCKNGYAVKKIQPVDMFPHTSHVETVCLLSKLHANQHIEVELQMDELDLTAAESKATYEEIKEYVLKQSGLKVSNLYVAQVKQKCGIIERENYNLPKSENSRQPKCPPEKEAAIREALEHFRMI
ncbi:MAG: 23S rRNA (uracil(1939)-C(5))-methyltransferase RlmD [Lachnospiraceae bacterium]